MNINSISPNVNLIKENTVKKQSDIAAPVKDVKQDVPKDRFEISSEASKRIVSDEKAPGVKNLDEIRQKIANKYYNSEEVIRKVADKIYKEISGTDENI